MEKGTTFENKCNILCDLWLNYKTDPDFVDFVSYNDIGLPLAFLIAEDMVKENERGRAFINETFDLLLASLEIEEDTGFESLDDLMVG